MNACLHCATAPIVRRVHPRTAGSVPVDLALCECDQLRCPHPRCKQPVGFVPIGVHRCPHCDGRL